MLACTGVDGSLLAPPAASPTESWPHMESWLRPLLQLIKECCLESGCSIEESIPAFHATDSFAEHRGKMRTLYDSIWPEACVATQADTPKGQHTDGLCMASELPAA